MLHCKWAAPTPMDRKRVGHTDGGYYLPVYRLVRRRGVLQVDSQEALDRHAAEGAAKLCGVLACRGLELSCAFEAQLNVTTRYQHNLQWRVHTYAARSVIVVVACLPARRLMRPLLCGPWTPLHHHRNAPATTPHANDQQQCRSMVSSQKLPDSMRVDASTCVHPMKASGVTMKIPGQRPELSTSHSSTELRERTHTHRDAHNNRPTHTGPTCTPESTDGTGGISLSSQTDFTTTPQEKETPATRQWEKREMRLTLG